MSTSQFMMLWKEVSWTPLALMPMKLDGKTLVQRKRLAPTVIMFPSESMWVCFLSELSVVDLSSLSLSKAM